MGWLNKRRILRGEIKIENIVAGKFTYDNTKLEDLIYGWQCDVDWICDGDKRECVPHGVCFICCKRHDGLWLYCQECLNKL